MTKGIDNFAHQARPSTSLYGRGISAGQSKFENNGQFFESEVFAGTHEIFHNIGQYIFKKVGLEPPKQFSSADEAIALTLQSIFQWSSDLVQINDIGYLQNWKMLLEVVTNTNRVPPEILG